MSPEPNTPHRFGGAWTTRKLEVLERYLKSYITALDGKPSAARPFRKAYIDGFAGTGTRADPESRFDDEQASLDLLEADPDLESGLLDGSARMALGIEPGFDRYIFIEKSPSRCDDLGRLGEEFPHRAGQITVRRGEANTEIRHMCSKDWSGGRAVLFLDPYGMQVEWSTLEAIASTRAIDLWLLFPLWMGVNRIITRSGAMHPSWRRRVTTLLGDESWADEFYRVEKQGNVFGGEAEVLHKVSTEVIGQRFLDRLQRIFAGVAPYPGVLRNSHNSPIFLLCFAAANEKGAPTALRIANHLLRELR